ncbi:MAG: 2,3-bisphosphoglycerate-independent phosphoglycerate mutase [Candidatus Magasanikbacteria bacterium GW2011_GWA2_46_17]|uniref:2,3-bisphosphoglycerate-independent phosphoglycerate mutase n=1 Tax=Candidatus Magasanikbacteria bacterium GW2011_GWA2_46_17 TaxID=1619042 RepID=A0A0G1R8P6_9BACT|nr:MAG: 2,3-bisphosphoglycerate-independent phosphoglycerate mutase [Candidatus Magasanikbacteria bacterium GW2011_GWA2_46_17]
MSRTYKPVVLIILDGWGVAPDGEGNAVTRAKTPNFDKLLKNYPTMTIHASGNEVGLLFGEMGNSEVGHLNIGAGRVYYQMCPRINSEIANENFFDNQALISAMHQVKNNKSQLHLIGLVSPGNVHSSAEHLYALLEMCKKHKLTKEVFIHAILDGRDAIYNSGKDFIAELQDKINKLKAGRIASLSGRYYAMDRDNRWDRTEKAYRAMAEGKAEQFAEDPVKAIEESYAIKNYDEDFTPTVIVSNQTPIATFKNGDAAIFFNFRSDRARQLTKAFVLPGFNKFKRGYLKDLYFVTMTEYEKNLPVAAAFSPVVVHNCLAEAISNAGLKQLHVAETEKYAHVTFFLNGTVEDPFPGEDRQLIPSPRVSTYDKKPEMSAAEVTKSIIKAIESKRYEFIVVNYANPDMVGHTGVLKAGLVSCEAADKGMGEVVEYTMAQGGVAIITADHGNAEEMINLQTGEIDKEHSTNPVPLIIVSKNLMGQAGPSGDPPEGDLSLLRPVGVLSDVAPTILKLLGVEQPKEMTGRALV